MKKGLQKNERRRHVSISLTAGMEAALEMLPKSKTDPVRDEKLFLRLALAEGICALAEHCRQTGRLLLPFRFTVLPGQPGRAPEFEERIGAEQAMIEAVLRSALEQAAKHGPDAR